MSELGSTLQYTGFVFFFQVCPGFCFPSSPCISTVRVGRFHRPALCGCRRLFLSVQCLQPGSTRDMWRVYPSPHGCFTSLSSLLNVQVISSPLLTSVKLAEPRALPVHLILRSLCKLTPLQIQRPPWQWQNTARFPSLPWLNHQTTELLGMGTTPGRNTNSVVFVDKHFSVCGMFSVSFWRAEMVVCDSFDQAL